MNKKPIIDLVEPDRSKRDKIERLRRRLDNAPNTTQAIVNVIKGILDLLGDEL